uniref:Uncharacterized protein n=1 Tax=Romanomermis culicivorax TaxID=13658 RepID=A0A915KCH2_ROMCU
MHQRFPVTILSNELRSKKAPSANNPTDLFDHSPSHLGMTNDHGHATQPSPLTTTRTRTPFFEGPPCHVLLNFSNVTDSFIVKSVIKAACRHCSAKHNRKKPFAPDIIHGISVFCTDNPSL